jgi:hypothetical protein
MSTTARDNKGKEDPKDEDHFKALMKFSSKCPNSVAFVDLADTRVSPEQRLLEMKLETLIEQCNDLQKRRVEYWSTPTGPSPMMLERFDPPNLLELRKQRVAEVSAAAKAHRPYEASSISNALHEVQALAATHSQTLHFNG